MTVLLTINRKDLEIRLDSFEILHDGTRAPLTD